MAHEEPRRLIHGSQERILSPESCRDLLSRAVRLSTGGGDVQISIRSRWTGNVRWARNEITSAGDTTDQFVEITRVVRGAAGAASTSRIDDDSLSECIRRAEERLRYSPVNEEATPLRRSERYLDTELWSDATYAVEASARAEAQGELVEAAVADGLLSAGYIETAAIGNGVLNTAGLFAYVPETRAECSVTVRDPLGTGAGWAGVAGKDWRGIDASAISSVAIQKCKASVGPVAIEPGRYTVILEAQAVSDLLLPLVRSLDRPTAERGMGPWADGARAPTPPPEVLAGMQSQADGPEVGMSKIGQRVLDSRITIGADPTDGDAPFVPFAWDSTPMRPVKWIEDGILRELSYRREYAVSRLNKPDPLNNGYAFRMSGGDTNVDAMVRATERGLLITRLVNVRMVDYPSLLCTGTTSDGLWLIERGEITRAVKNFRFRDSPLFAFNNIDLMGQPVRVLQHMPTVVPPVRVRDFSLTSLADAV